MSADAQEVPRLVGDPAGDFEVLRSQLERAVRRVCPSWLAEARDDLVQTALIKIFELRRRRGGGQQELSPSYLYRVAYSALVDEIRHRRRRREQPLAGPEEERVGADRDPDPGPEQRLESRDVGRAIHECLAALSPRRRRAVTLYLLGHSVAESAAILDWPLKGTQNRIYRGMNDLRTCLRAKGHEP